jgi:hypothetical protein
MRPQRFDSVPHRVSGGNSGQVCQGLQNCALVWSLFKVRVVRVSGCFRLRLLRLA